jgi:hypothetical protein
MNDPAEIAFLIRLHPRGQLAQADDIPTRGHMLTGLDELGAIDSLNLGDQKRSSFNQLLSGCFMGEAVSGFVPQLERGRASSISAVCPFAICRSRLANISERIAFKAPGGGDPGAPGGCHARCGHERLPAA